MKSIIDEYNKIKNIIKLNVFFINPSPVRNGRKRLDEFGHIHYHST
jgi:hypothetical protein